MTESPEKESVDRILRLFDEELARTVNYNRNPSLFIVFTRRLSWCC